MSECTDWEDQWREYSEKREYSENSCEETPNIVSHYIENMVRSRSQPMQVNGEPSSRSRVVTGARFDLLPRYDGETMQPLVTRSQAQELLEWIGPLEESHG